MSIQCGLLRLHQSLGTFFVVVCWHVACLTCMKVAGGLPRHVLESSVSFQWQARSSWASPEALPFADVPQRVMLQRQADLCNAEYTYQTHGGLQAMVFKWKMLRTFHLQQTGQGASPYGFLGLQIALH